MDVKQSVRKKQTILEDIHLKDNFFKCGSIERLASYYNINRKLMSVILYTKGLLKVASIDRIPLKDLKDKYNELKSVKRVAAFFNVSSNLLKVRMEKEGLKFNNKTNKVDFSNKETLILLNDEESTDLDKAKKLGVDTRTLRDAYKKCGIKKKRRNQFGYCVDTSKITKDALIEFLEGKKHFDSLGISRKTFHNLLLKFGLIDFPDKYNNLDIRDVFFLIKDVGIKEAAKVYSLDKEVLSIYLKFNGVKPNYRFFPKDILDAFLNTKKVSLVAKKFNTKPETVRAYLHIFGVDTSKDIPTKEEVIEDIKSLELKFGHLNIEILGNSKYSMDVIRGIFGTSSQIKDTFKIKNISLQEDFLCYFEAIFNVKLQREVSLGCINPKTSRFLKFDGYWEEKGLLIEFDDISHFRNVYNNSISDFAEARERDTFKTYWALANGYKLFRFRYFESWKREDVVSRVDELLECQVYNTEKFDIIQPNVLPHSQGRLQFMPWEVMEKQHIINSMLKAKEGLISNKIYARTLIIKEVKANVAFDFYEKNHLLGGIYPQKSLGLFTKGGKLISLMSFNDFVLVRFATIIETICVGGFSKLFKAFNKDYVETFLDIRQSTSKSVYEKQGFILAGKTTRNYFYYKDGKHYFRRTFQKKEIKKYFENNSHGIFYYKDNLTEKELMSLNGFSVFYDLGQLKFIYKNRDSKEE